MLFGQFIIFLGWLLIGISAHSSQRATMLRQPSTVIQHEVSNNKHENKLTVDHVMYSTPGYNPYTTPGYKSVVVGSGVRVQGRQPTPTTYSSHHGSPAYAQRRSSEEQDFVREVNEIFIPSKGTISPEYDPSPSQEDGSDSKSAESREHPEYYDPSDEHEVTKYTKFIDPKNRRPVHVVISNHHSDDPLSISLTGDGVHDSPLNYEITETIIGDKKPPHLMPGYKPLPVPPPCNRPHKPPPPPPAPPAPPAPPGKMPMSYPIGVVSHPSPHQMHRFRMRTRYFHHPVLRPVMLVNRRVPVRVYRPPPRVLVKPLPVVPMKQVHIHHHHHHHPNGVRTSEPPQTVQIQIQAGETADQEESYEEEVSHFHHHGDGGDGDIEAELERHRQEHEDRLMPYLGSVRKPIKALPPGGKFAEPPHGYKPPVTYSPTPNRPSKHVIG